MKILVTGADGFLGWHTRLALRATTDHEVVPVGRGNWNQLPELITGAGAVIHLAGVNRAPSERDVVDGNLGLATDLAHVLDRANTGVRVVYSNSLQAGNGTPYGSAKAEAGDILAAGAGAVGGTLVDIRFPNLFGEHGLPGYNSFVATFIDAVITQQTPSINDAEVPLMHAQDAATIIVDALSGPPGVQNPAGASTRVADVWDLLVEFDRLYATGDIPDLSTPFRLNLFNSYRAAKFRQRPSIELTANQDARGAFVETVRCHGGQGQTSVSTTVPGVTRGEHFHLRKVERFVVVSGAAQMQIRRLFSNELVTIAATGEHPIAVDMPTGWAHNITNVGEGTLLTQFWSHELFDPLAPDTFPSPVDHLDRG